MDGKEDFELAQAAHEAGRLGEAKGLYRQALAANAALAEAEYFLGVIACQESQHHAAIASFQRAVSLDQEFFEAYFDLANVLRSCGRVDEAIEAFYCAIRCEPGVAVTHFSLGNALQDRERFEEAIAAYRNAVAIQPDFLEAVNNLGDVLRKTGQFDEALVACRRAVALSPNHPQLQYNLANALSDLGKSEDAIVAYRRAISVRPDFPEAFNNLGNVLREEGQSEDAVAAFRSAISLRPDYADAHYNLGNAMRADGKPDLAVAAYQRAISLRADFVDAFTNLGNALKDKGDLGGAIAAYRRAIHINGGSADSYSNLLYALHFSPDHDAQTIAEEHRRWNLQIVEPLRKQTSPHQNDRTPSRRLRIGYVSGDFRHHCQTLFTLPLFCNHDRDRFEIFCYSSVAHPDRFTQQLRGLSDVWRDVGRLRDREVCDIIRRDEIDIVVDLTMHMAGGRQMMFALGPAPVQAAWLAYPGTTGNASINYVLTDPWLTPPEFEKYYSERILRLPETFWCYHPDHEADLPISPIRARENGSVTFSCLNNFCKINEHVLRLWARILRAVPASRLLLLAPMGSARQSVIRMMVDEGIKPSRIEFSSFLPRQQYLELYSRADIGLDTFPYNGHTTSLDSFWMGVPVITLAGQTSVGRAGVCQLMNLDLPELIAEHPDKFVQIATDLEYDPPRLAHVRSTLRQRMQASPLMDAPRFARNLEAAYRQMWREWCASGRRQ
jgi:protein O-GlcNAc transferase